MRHSVTLEDIYRPQRSCGKAMFLQLSVILSTGEGGCIPAYTGADTSLSRGLLQWTVRILLECILVQHIFPTVFSALTNKFDLHITKIL